MNDNDLKALSNQQEMDQLFSSLAAMAAAMFRYYQGLLDAGFSKADAITLALDMQRTLIGGKK